jgi:hypothetical protein
MRVLGVSLAPRLVGAALVVGGEPVVLRAMRLSTGAHAARAGLRVEQWLGELLRVYPAAVVALDLGRRDARFSGAMAQELAAAVRRCAVAAGATVVDVARADVCRALGIASPTNASILEHVSTRYHSVAARLGRSSAFRTEAERYWERPGVAAGVALTALFLLDAPACPASAHPRSTSS